MATTGFTVGRTLHCLVCRKDLPVSVPDIQYPDVWFRYLVNTREAAQEVFPDDWMFFQAHHPMFARTAARATPGSIPEDWDDISPRHQTWDRSDTFLPAICGSCVDQIIQPCDSCDEATIPNSYLLQLKVGELDPSNRDRPHRTATATMVNYIIERYVDVIHEPVLTMSGDNHCSGCAYQCDDCGEWFSWQCDAEDCCSPQHDEYDCDCDECTENRGSRGVHSWGFRPALRFHRHYPATGQSERLASATVFGGNPYRRQFQAKGREEPLYFGLELEFEHASDRAYDFLQAAGEDFDEPRFVFCKTDGSLSSYGIELNTMPATYDWLFRSDESARFWNALETFDDAEVNGCGMHVHLHRLAFTSSHLYKFVRFHVDADAQTLCQLVGDRTNSTYASWAEFAYSDSYRRTLSVVKGDRSPGGRYVPVNLANSTTIELRYFAATADKAVVQRRLEYIRAMYDFTRQVSVAQVGKLGPSLRDPFLWWLERERKSFPVLHPWLLSHLDGDSFVEGGRMTAVGSGDAQVIAPTDAHVLSLIA